MASSSTKSYDFFVGTFNTPQLYTLTFTPPTSPSGYDAALSVKHTAEAVGSHSWLHLSPPKPDGTRNLYATAWLEPPAVVAYAVDSPTSIRLLGTATTRSRSGYVAASEVACYSAGGATGEVFALDRTSGNFVSPTSASVAKPTSTTTPTSTTDRATPLQDLSFLDAKAQRDDGSVMDFGGLRHGAHSADLSPDGRALYIADIGRNCIWTYAVSETGTLTLGEKHISPRPTDGPRHVWPHPTGRYVYCLQEHTSMVDVFETREGGTLLTHVQGVRIIPAHEAEGDFWADEVRTSFSAGEAPEYLYASTRGLKEGKRGYVAVFKLTREGLIDTSYSVSSTSASAGLVNGHSNAGLPNGAAVTNGTIVVPHSEKNALYAGLLDLWQTPTSGGWANAIQPGPTVEEVEYLALTDSEGCQVFVLAWDGLKITEAARVKLDDGAGAATAVWL